LTHNIDEEIIEALAKRKYHCL